LTTGPSTVTSSYPTSSEVREVGPRDGLQNESPISVDERVRLIDALSATGLRALEVGSFVSPSAVPPMAGTDRVLAAIARNPDVRYRVLVPNLHGARLALEAGIDELEVVVSVSRTHNIRNLKMSVDDSVEHIAAIVELAHAAGVPVEAIVATAFGCPYEGAISPTRTRDLAERLRGVGVTTFSFADTTGMAVPTSITGLVHVLDTAGVEPSDIALHLHNTRGTGLANLVVAAQHGVRRFDASIGGLGGCPFSPGATGNIPTEDAVYLLDSLGADTGVDLDALIAVSLDIETVIGRTLPGQLMRSGRPYAAAPVPSPPTTAP
jgi:hydroxymethylglutaryl-CoA lyase